MSETAVLQRLKVVVIKIKRILKSLLLMVISLFLVLKFSIGYRQAGVIIGKKWILAQSPVIFCVFWKVDITRYATWPVAGNKYQAFHQSGHHNRKHRKQPEP